MSIRRGAWVFGVPCCDEVSAGHKAVLLSIHRLRLR